MLPISEVKDRLDEVEAARKELAEGAIFSMEQVLSGFDPARRPKR